MTFAAASAGSVLGRFLIAAAALAAMPGLAGADAFTVIPSPHPVGTFALTEDGAYLVLAQTADNQLSIWDVRKGALIKDIACAAPAQLLCRDNRVYVAGQPGKLAVYTVGTWSQSDEIETGAGTAVNLSAAHGSHFDGRIVVTGLDGKSSHIVVVDANEQHQEILHGPAQMVAAVSADGAAAAVSVEEHYGHLELMPFAAFMAGKTDARPGAAYRLNHLTQEHPGGVWIGADGIYAGDPLVQVVLDGQQVAVNGLPLTFAAMDALSERVYFVRDDHVDAFALEVGLPVVDGWDSSRPAHNPHGAWTGAGQAISQAATLDGVTHIFIEAKPGEVLVEDHVLSATGTAAAPANAGFPTVAVVGQPVACRLAGGGDFKVMVGPSGLAIAADGSVQWTPSAAEIGSHHIKIRAGKGNRTGMEGGAAILRASCTVVVPEAAGLADRGLSDAFTPLPCRDAVSSFVLTDDGRWLVLAHRSAGKLSIWDVGKGAMAQVIDCPSPVALVARKGNLYVASQGAANISVFSLGDWIPGESVRSGGDAVVGLSAPGGKWFTGKLLVTTKDGGSLVDTASGTSTRLPVPEWSTMGWTGDIIISHSSYPWGPITVYHNADPGSAKSSRGEDIPLLTQCQAGGMWVGGNAIWQGALPVPAVFTDADPERMWLAPRQQVAMDLNAQVVYRICEDHVDAYGMNFALPKLGTWRTTAHQPPEPSDSNMERVWMNAAGPQAVTSDGVVHLFILGNHPGVVLAAALPGLDAITAKTGTGP